jgi:hypothetical protein
VKISSPTVLPFVTTVLVRDDRRLSVWGTALATLSNQGDPHIADRNTA